MMLGPPHLGLEPRDLAHHPQQHAAVLAPPRVLDAGRGRRPRWRRSSASCCPPCRRRTVANGASCRAVLHPQHALCLGHDTLHLEQLDLALHVADQQHDAVVDDDVERRIRHHDEPLEVGAARKLPDDRSAEPVVSLRRRQYSRCCSARPARRRSSPPRSKRSPDLSRSGVTQPAIVTLPSLTLPVMKVPDRVVRIALDHAWRTLPRCRCRSGARAAPAR